MESREHPNYRPVDDIGILILRATHEGMGSPWFCANLCRVFSLPHRILWEQGAGGHPFPFREPERILTTHPKCHISEQGENAKTVTYSDEWVDEVLPFAILRNIFKDF